MAEQFDGLGIARKRIAAEAGRQTGFFDLGCLGLTELPAELYSLDHLRRLNLGRGITCEDGQWREAAADGSSNQTHGELGRIGELTNLEALLSETNLVSLANLTQLEHLFWLDCSRTAHN